MSRGRWDSDLPPGAMPQHHSPQGGGQRGADALDPLVAAFAAAGVDEPTLDLKDLMNDDFLVLLDELSVELCDALDRVLSALDERQIALNGIHCLGMVLNIQNLMVPLIAQMDGAGTRKLIIDMVTAALPVDVQSYLEDRPTE